MVDFNKIHLPYEAWPALCVMHYRGQAGQPAGVNVLIDGQEGAGPGFDNHFMEWSRDTSSIISDRMGGRILFLNYISVFTHLDCKSKEIQNGNLESVTESVTEPL